MIGVALTLSWGIVRGALEIAGSSTCPTPEQVEAELARRPGLSPLPNSPSPIDLSAVLNEEQTGDPLRRQLHLRLFDAAGQLLGERTLLADAQCQAMAATIATLLLSFELDLGEAPPKDRPAPASVTPAPAPRHRTRLAAEVGAGGFGSLTSDGADAVAALALASLSIGDSLFQPELAGEIESPRQLGIGPGGAALAHWARLWAAPGLQIRFLRRPGIWASAHFDVPIGATIATGTNLTPNRSGILFDFGISGGLRVGLGPASLSGIGPGLVPWAGLWVIGWPLRREVFLTDLSNQNASQSQLPQFEMLLGLGLSWSSI